MTDSINLSGRVHFDHIKTGDVLYKFFDGHQSPTLLGKVIDKSENSKGKTVLILDRVTSLGSDRLTRSAFQRLTIRYDVDARLANN
jgi:hypothetical protein